MKARRPPFRAHSNFIASPRLPDKYHGAGPSAHRDNDDNRVLITIADCRLWASKHRGATLIVRVNALSVSQWNKKMTLDVPGAPVSKVENGFVQKSSSSSE